MTSQPPEARQIAEQIAEGFYDYHPLGTVAMSNVSCRSWLVEAITQALTDATAKGEEERDAEHAAKLQLQQALNLITGQLHDAEAQLAEARSQGADEAYREAFDAFVLWARTLPSTAFTHPDGMRFAAVIEELRQRGYPPQDITDLLAALDTAEAEGRRKGLEDAEAKLREIAAGPFTGDGIIGPLHAVGLASGFRWAADTVRQLLPEAKTS